MTEITASIIEHYRTPLLSSLPVAIYSCDTEGKISFFNEAAADLWGRRPKIGKDLWCGSWKIYNTDGSPLSLDKCPMALTLKEARAVHGEEIIVERPDGSRLYVLPHPSPLFDDDGILIGAVNMLVDITAKRHVEAALRESEKKYKDLSASLELRVKEKTVNLSKSEERYHKMIEEVQDYAIILLDVDGNIMNWNKGAQNIKGYTEEQIIGKNFRIFYRESDRREMLPEKLIAEAIEKGKANHEGWRLRRDGTQFWGSIVITALHDEQQNIIGFSKVTRDLTEKKLADDRLQEYAHNISFQNNQLERYAYVASHDLQEPLRKIRVYSDMLEQSTADPETAKKLSGKIKSAAARMSDLIKDILAYSKVSQHDQEHIDVDLNNIFEEVKQDYELMLQEKKVRLSASGLPVVKGVAVQLHQLFANLISNAVKFSNDNPLVEITAKNVSKTDAKMIPGLNPAFQYVWLSFKDNGCGFDSKYAGEVFDLFKRLDTEKSGTGIGLALCKKIVENHGGQINVSSEPGKGSCFNIFLPV